MKKKRAISARQADLLYKLIFSFESHRDLEKIQRYIAFQSSPTIAAKYARSITDFCETLQYSPYRGEERSHVRQGLRTIGFRRRVSIHFKVSDEDHTVRIARILYAGRQASGELR